MGKLRNSITIVVVIGVLATACGSSTKATSTTSPAPTSVQAIASASPAVQTLASPSPSAASGPDCGTLAGLSGPVNDKGTTKAAGKTAEIQMVGGFAFTPTCLEAKAGTTLAITVSDTDQETHTFTITKLKIDETVSPGQSVVIHIKVPASGAIPFFCSYHQNFGQQGAIVVEP